MNKVINLITTFCFILIIATSCEKEPILDATQSSLTITDQGGIQTISFSTNKGWAATVTGGGNWCTISQSNGKSGVNSITVTVVANTTYEDRTASISLRVDGLTKTVLINQNAKPAIILSKKEYVVSDTESTIEIALETNINFDCASSANWINRVESKGLKSTILKLTIASNLSNNERDGKVMLMHNNDSLIEIHIHQTKSEFFNLCIDGIANSYIAPMSGKYRIRSNVKGNNPNLSINNASKAELLWETINTTEILSANTVIKNVNYNSSIGYINFETTANSGNAVIAVKDDSDKILWSWHIWVTNYNPEEGYNLYVKSNEVLMDRNLGALTASPGDTRAFGLLYQWGRKDPFTGGARRYYPGKEATTYPLEAFKFEYITQTKGTVEYSILNPASFLYKPNMEVGDWIYNSPNNALWNKTKTIYDPCPNGWRVPDGGQIGVWRGFPEGYNSHPYDWSKGGMFFGSEFCVPTAWYPSIAPRPFSGGTTEFLDYGFYWACNTNGSSSHIFVFDSGGNYVSPYTMTSRLMGLPVRCQKIK